MISHEEKLVNQWRNEHKMLDFLIMLSVCFVGFVLVPMIFGVFYKLFGVVHDSTSAWFVGFLTTVAVVCLISFKYTKKK